MPINNNLLKLGGHYALMLVSFTQAVKQMKQANSLQDYTASQGSLYNSSMSNDSFHCQLKTFFIFYNSVLCNVYSAH